jgi:hypothetical protein
LIGYVLEVIKIVLLVGKIFEILKINVDILLFLLSIGAISQSQNPNLLF